MDYQDTKTDLVINKVTRNQYDRMVLSNLIDDRQLYMVTDDSAVEGDSRYNLQNVVPVLSSVTIEGETVNALTCQVNDLAITNISVTLSSTPLYVYLPQQSDNGGRDFMVRVEVYNSVAPTVGFFGYGGEECDFESEDDEWATIKPGTNLFNFTETKRT